MDADLMEISQAGNIAALYELTKKNGVDLKRIDEIMFEDTPLHIAVSAGQISFAMEMMNLMPSFARKLNKDGLSPIHLALLKGNTELILLLLRADCELIRVKGRGGMTPLHYAAQIGNIDLLGYFLVACPTSIEDITVESETTLHIAVKNERLEALEVLVGWFKRACHKNVFSWKTNIPNWRDKQGKTVLDIAISKPPEVIKLLVEINARNSMGLTALDTLQLQNSMSRSKVQKMLRNTRDSRPSYPKNTKTLANYLRSKINFDEKVAICITRQRTQLSPEIQNALLVVAVVFIAATFQPIFSPPGGFRQENDNPTVMINGTYINTTVTNTTNGGKSPSNKAGTIVMEAYNFAAISCTNTFVLCTVIGVVALLLPHNLLGVNMILMLVYLLVGYALSIAAIVPDSGPASFVLLPLLLFFLFMMSIKTIYWSGMKKILKLCYDANKCPMPIEPAVDEDQNNNNARTTNNESNA